MGMAIDKPEPDGHFMLKSCGHCQSSNVVYIGTITGGTVQYAAKCLGCGQRTPMHRCKHDAQQDWNGRFAGKEVRHG